MIRTLLHNYFETVLNDASGYYEADPWPYGAYDQEDYVDRSVDRMERNIVNFLRREDPDVEMLLSMTQDDIYRNLNEWKYTHARNLLSNLFSQWNTPTWVDDYFDAVHPEDVTPFDQFVFTVSRIQTLN